MKSKKMYKSIVAIALVCVMLVMCMGAGYSGETTQFGTNATTIILGSKNNLSFSAGQELSFTIRIHETRYYVVETRGNSDTFLTVEGLTAGTLTNDDSGVGSNAKIEFRGEDCVVTIKVKLYNSTATGSTQLQIRKQHAMMFGFDYGFKADGTRDIDTRTDLDAPYDSVDPIYETYLYTDDTINGVTQILEEIWTGYSRLNSEIVFVSGHGAPGLFSFPNSNYIYASNINAMENTKLILWAACNSSTKNEYNVSMTSASVSAGAATAIGWSEVTLVQSSRTFTNRFFSKLSEGVTINDAALYASNGIIWPWDSIKNYEIEGNATQRLFPTATSPTLSAGAENTEIDFSNSEEYRLYAISENKFRAYKLVGEYISNDYYDLYMNDGIVTNAYHSGYNISDMPVRNIDTTKGRSVKQYSQDGAVESHIVYVSLNNEVVPIEINYITQFNEVNQGVMSVICRNLYSGECVDYEDISYII